jgi:cytochrome c oxidase subunit 2
MQGPVQLLPEQAATIATDIDLLIYGLVGVSLFFFLLVTALIAFFAIRYRAGSKANRVRTQPDKFTLEIIWTIIPTILALGFFVWSMDVFFDYFRVPENSHEILVTGKQWMWKIQHPNGKREINELHVPVDTDIKLTMTSEDVIHSFFVPAFRIKKDVLPGKFTDLAFRATKPGRYHLFCAEYCGLNHSTMTGTVVVMEQNSYQEWLRTGTNPALASQGAGEQLFTRLGCAVCHRESAGARGPSLNGLLAREVELRSGEVIQPDDEYIRESIVNPRAKLVAGYPALMPTYKNQLTGEELLQLVDYVKSLSETTTAQSTP